jgi:16S rRNA (guanine527-N7)-methyltransferase
VFPELVRRCARLSDEQTAALESHYRLLCRWNKVLNLTAIDRLEEAVERHYCESLVLAERLPETGTIADIGSGAGFPGFVIAIAKPGSSVTLIESHQRKAVFLKEAARGVRNASVAARRAEGLQERFDWVVSRAVSYRDLSRSLPRLAPRVALLTGAEEPPVEWGFRWQAFALRGGRSRFVRIGIAANCFT